MDLLDVVLPTRYKAIHRCYKNISKLALLQEKRKLEKILHDGEEAEKLYPGDKPVPGELFHFVVPEDSYLDVKQKIR